METRKLRKIEVSAIGYGCMGLSGGYGTTPTKDEAIKLIRSAYDMGCTLFNTAEYYVMDSVNEELVGEALKEFRNKASIVTKFYIMDNWEGRPTKDLMPELRTRLENSLKKLGTDHVETYIQGRVNKDIPLEEVAYCMGEFIKEGKILGWGLSQVTADEIQRSHAITPLTAIESEYSIMERLVEKEVLPLCEKLNIGFLAFSPLAAGFLSGNVNTNIEYAEKDRRSVINRFEKENIKANQPLLDLLHHFGDEKNVTPAQISLAWMLHKNDFIVPIPGSRKLERIKENLLSADIKLTNTEFQQIETELSKIKIYGDGRRKS